MDGKTCLSTFFIHLDVETVEGEVSCLNLWSILFYLSHLVQVILINFTDTYSTHRYLKNQVK